MRDAPSSHFNKPLWLFVTLALSSSFFASPTFSQNKRPRAVTENAPRKPKPAPPERPTFARLRIINPHAVDALSVSPAAYKQLVRDYLQIAHELDNYAKK